MQQESQHCKFHEIPRSQCGQNTRKDPEIHDVVPGLTCKGFDVKVKNKTDLHFLLKYRIYDHEINDNRILKEKSTSKN